MSSTSTAASHSLPTLALLPGLGADARLFEDLRPHAPAFVTPDWQAPLPRESLRDYAARWAPTLRSELGDGPLVLGGMSFGGQLALELARHLQPNALVLLSSHPDASELTPSFRRQVRMLSVLPDALLRWGMRRLAMPAIARREHLSKEQRERLVAMARDTDLAFFRWASVATTSWSWQPGAALPCPLQRLHGEHDRIIPLGRREGVDLLDAGHLIPMTHAEQVGAWLHAAMRYARLGCDERDAGEI
ncbi:MAG: pimeloyl-ACP methyl ester carboxylesterase [Neolewinella sp.]